MSAGEVVPPIPEQLEQVGWRWRWRHKIGPGAWMFAATADDLPGDGESRTWECEPIFRLSKEEPRG